MNMRSLIPVLLVAALALVGCGSATSSVDNSSDSTTSDERNGLKSMTGPPVRASADEVVIADRDGKDVVFKVRDGDSAGVDVAHMSSHAGVKELDFRIYYREEDGVRYATAAEEVEQSCGSSC